MKTTRHDSFAAYVLPSVLAFALSGLYTIVDGFFIGQSLGDLGLAAITLAYPAAALLQAVGTGIGLAGAIRCTILQARGEEQTPRTCFSGTVLLLLATSAVFAAVLLGLPGPVLTVLGAQDEARPLAAEYIRVIACGTAFQILATGLVPFIRNLGGSAFAMVAMGTGFVTNIALDYLFVWEFHWGMAGGAWATVIGQAATMLLAIGYLVACGLRAAEGGRGAAAVGRTAEGRGCADRADVFAEHHAHGHEPLPAAVRRRAGDRGLRLHRLCALDDLHAAAGRRRRQPAAHQQDLRRG